MVKGKNIKPLYEFARKEEFNYTRKRGEELTYFYDRGYSGLVTNFDTNLELEAYKLGFKVKRIFETLDRNFYSVGRDSILIGPSVAKKLKKHLQYGFLNSYEDGYENYKGDRDNNQKLEDYDDIFPYEHCFPWKEDDPKDILESMKPVNALPEALDAFRRVFGEILSEIDDITWDDNMMNVIASKGGTSASASKEKFRGFAKIINGTKSSKVMDCKRSVIRVHPANTRDSVILDAASANAVSKCSYFCQQIVYQLKESIMKSSADEEEHALRKSMKVFRRHGFCYTRDFKKDGLTKPKILIKIIHEELQKKYPGIDFDCFSPLYNQRIELDVDIEGVGKAGQRINPPRGHSLGMGNELTTLIQIIISRMVMKNVMLDNPVSIDIWNDDFRCHGSRTDLVNIRNVDERVLRHLDYPLSTEKTRILDGATVFLEEYSFTDDTIHFYKDNRRVANLCNIPFARNIYEAKEYARSIYEESNDIFIENEKVSTMFIKFITEWGYEFTPNEFMLPARFGGWFTCKYLYLDETFNLQSFEQVSTVKLRKLFNAENTSVDMKYKRTYAFSKYSNRQLSDKRELTEIERILAPHGDILLSNFKSIAGQTEAGLHRSRLSDLYYDLMLKSRQHNYNLAVEETSRAKLIQDVITRDRFKSYAIPMMYCTITNSFVQDEATTSYKSFGKGLLDDLYIEWKYLNKQNLSLRQKTRLLTKSRLIMSNAGRDAVYTVIPNKDAVDKKILRYYNNHRYLLTYYAEEYGGIPSKVYLELPDKFEGLFLTEDEFNKFVDLQDKYPSNISEDEACYLDRFIKHHDLDIDDEILLYTHIKTLKEKAHNIENCDFIIQNTLDYAELLKLTLPEPPEEHSVEEEAEDGESISDGEIQVLTPDQLLGLTDQGDESAETTPEEEGEVPFEYTYLDHHEWGEDEEWIEDDLLLYGE